MSEKNSLLRAERLRRSWTQEHLAGFSGVSVRTIQRAERGEPIRIDNVRLLCDCFGKTAQELGLTFMEEQEKKKDIILVPNLADQVLDNKLDSAESIINLAWDAWFSSRPQEARRVVTMLMADLESVAYSSYLSQIYMLRAKELLIRGHGLLGTLCLDALQNDNSLYHYVQAHKIAEELHDKNLTATYLTLMGDVLRRQNEKSQALAHMERAQDIVKDSSPVVRGHILQLLAYTYGDTGQEAKFERAISEATDLLSFTGEGRDVEKKEFIPFEIYEIRGKVNRDLGKPLEAIPYLELAEKSLIKVDSVTPRWHALLEISRAQAFCDAGDIDTGVDLAIKGFLMAFKCQSLRQMNRVRKLLKKLEGTQFKNHPKVNDLRNLLHETYLRLDETELASKKPYRKAPFPT